MLALLHNTSQFFSSLCLWGIYPILKLLLLRSTAMTKKGVAASKFKDRPKFATSKKGPICLKDHSDRVDIKIRRLPAGS
jgi:hypothetical protein